VDQESGHLATCAACRADLASMREVAALGAETQEVRDLPQPPDRLWRDVLAEIDATESLTAGATAGRPLRWLPARRTSRWLPGWRLRPALAAGLAGALAAVLAVAGTITVSGWVGRDGRPGAGPADGASVTAQARLARLPTAPTSVAGDARVLAGGGQERLHLHVTGLPLSTGYYEVWLINPATEQMMSVGTLGPTTDALLPLPGTVDLNAYRVVDVSAEAYDGQVAHSGHSLLRGSLTS
jgi:hypothetical protein